MKEQSTQFAQLSIYNIVLFDGDCTLKDVSYSQFGTFVGYAGNIMRVLKTIKGFGEAEYTDKKEVARVLRETVRNGENPVEEVKDGSVVFENVSFSYELLLDYCTRYYERQFITRENKNKAILEKMDKILV